MGSIDGEWNGGDTVGINDGFRYSWDIGWVEELVIWVGKHVGEHDVTNDGSMVGSLVGDNDGVKDGNWADSHVGYKVGVNDGSIDRGDEDGTGNILHVGIEVGRIEYSVTEFVGS